MAKAIRHLEHREPTPGELQAQTLAELMQAAAVNGDALIKIMEVLKQLDDMRVLNILLGLLKERTAVAEIALQQVNQPTMRNVIKNGMNSFKFVGALDPQKLEQLTNGLSRGLERLQASTTADAPSLWQLGKTMREPSTRQAMGSLMAFLQGFGESLSGAAKEDK